MAKISIAYPETWLSPSISVVNTTTNIEDFSGVMTEVWTTKVYIYEFTEVVNTDYAYVITTAGYNDISDAIFYSSSSGWLTTEEHDKLMWITGGGGYAVSQWLDAQEKKYLRETHEKVLKLENTDLSGIDTKLNDIDSHITLAFDDTIDRIEEVETEVCSDIVRVKSELKKDNVATRNLVRQKTKKINEKLDKDEQEEGEWNEVLELLKEIKEESDDKELLEFLDDVESKDIETLLT